jgi:hypothetical protein
MGWNLARFVDSVSATISTRTSWWDGASPDIDVSIPHSALRSRWTRPHRLDIFHLLIILSSGPAVVDLDIYFSRLNNFVLATRWRASVPPPPSSIAGCARDSVLSVCSTPYHLSLFDFADRGSSSTRTPTERTDTSSP